jgi:uncharacterized protein (UPF0276 family)
MLAAGIVANLERIDVIELMAEDYFDAPRRELRAITTLAAHVPIVLHGVSLGLGSARLAPTSLLDRMARLVEALRPESWSEHLAFVRSEEVELGHLAAPPRTDATIEGARRNLRRARSIVGSLPQMENVATLIDPPGSTLEEGPWISAIASASGCELLLDLHNLHANAVNFRFDPVAFLEHIPLERVATIHIAGGSWVRADGAGAAEPRWLDDHLHSVPPGVYGLLEELAARSPRPLTVVLERDGRFPPFATLLDEMESARAALRQGRARRVRGAERAA